jgi:hypothetical protein
MHAAEKGTNRVQKKSGLSGKFKLESREISTSFIEKQNP